MTCRNCQTPGPSHHRLNITDGVPTRTYSCDLSEKSHPVAPSDAADELRGVAAQLDPAPPHAVIRPAWMPAEERAFTLASFKAGLATGLGARLIVPWLVGCLTIVIALGLGLAKVFDAMSRWFA